MCRTTRVEVSHGNWVVTCCGEELVEGVVCRRERSGDATWGAVVGTDVYSQEWISCSGFFFFQAEDGIRDYKVTGVQTCALPISRDRAARTRGSRRRSRRARTTRARRSSLRRGDRPPAGTARSPSARRRDSTPARDRESGGEGKRGDLGGRRII